LHDLRAGDLDPALIVGDEKVRNMIRNFRNKDLCLHCRNRTQLLRDTISPLPALCFDSGIILLKKPVHSGN
jgi:hypothetical protein